MMVDCPFACVGQITKETDLVVKGLGGDTIVSVPVGDLKRAWQAPFGDLI